MYDAIAGPEAALTMTPLDKQMRVVSAGISAFLMVLHVLHFILYVIVFQAFGGLLIIFTVLAVHRGALVFVDLKKGTVKDRGLSVKLCPGIGSVFIIIAAVSVLVNGTQFHALHTPIAICYIIFGLIHLVLSIVMLVRFLQDKDVTDEAKAKAAAEAAGEAVKDAAPQMAEGAKSGP